MFFSQKKEEGGLSSPHAHRGQERPRSLFFMKFLPLPADTKPSSFIQQSCPFVFSKGYASME